MKEIKTSLPISSDPFFICEKNYIGFISLPSSGSSANLVRFYSTILLSMNNLLPFEGLVSFIIPLLKTLLESGMVINEWVSYWLSLGDFFRYRTVNKNKIHSLHSTFWEKTVLLLYFKISMQSSQFSDSCSLIFVVFIQT